MTSPLHNGHVLALLLHLIVAIGVPVDTRLAVLGAGVLLASAGMALLLGRVLAAESRSHDGQRMVDGATAPDLAAVVSETIWTAAGRPEPRAPSCGLRAELVG